VSAITCKFEIKNKKNITVNIKLHAKIELLILRQKEDKDGDGG